MSGCVKAWGVHFIAQLYSQFKANAVCPTSSRINNVYSPDPNGYQGHNDSANGDIKYYVLINPEFIGEATTSAETNRSEITLTPQFLIMGHELVHAYHDISGGKNSKRGKYTYYDTCGVQQSDIAKAEELDTVGIDYSLIELHDITNVYASRNKYTENALRKEHNGYNARVKY